MPILGDLGFSYFVIAVLVFPLIALVASHKWRLAEARNDEVRRLLALVSEETDAVEFESSSFYATGPSLASQSVCEVCYAPTNRRCSQCKVVRYCSGRCQIIHWRRGHKDECQPCEGDNNMKRSSQTELKSDTSDSCNKAFSEEQKSEKSVDPYHIHHSSSFRRYENEEENNHASSSSDGMLFSAQLQQGANRFESCPDTETLVNSNEMQYSDVMYPKIETAQCAPMKSLNAPNTDSCYRETQSEPVSSSNRKTNSSDVTVPFALSTSGRASKNLSIPKIQTPKETRPDNGSSEKIGSDTLNNKRTQSVKSSGPSKHNASSPNGTRERECSRSLSNDGHSTKDEYLKMERSKSSSAKINILLPLKKSENFSGSPSGTERYAYTNRTSARTLPPPPLPTTSVADHTKLSRFSENQSFRRSSKQKSIEESFPYDLFSNLYKWKAPDFKPSGLENHGNSCYANAVLQCLAFTPPLTAYLLQARHSDSCVEKSWCFICAFEALMMEAKDGRKSPLSPRAIISQLGKIGSNGRQEDAHEFLRYVVEAMQAVCLKNSVGSSDEDRTLIGLTFGGYLRSKIKCMRCHCKTERNERMMDLTVEIDRDIGTLEEALGKFTSTEVLDGENKYKCTRCKSYERAKKKLTIMDAPNVLTIALKRFSSGKFGKINKGIRFPETLELTPYMSRNGSTDGSNVYSLYGVVIHVDKMNAAFEGHYVCYVKNMQNKWFMVDDDTVKSMGREKVYTRGAYMLFYSRCSSKRPFLDVRRRRDDYQRRGIFDADSDTTSLFSGSEECSCSTESTRDSASTDDFSEYVFSDVWRSAETPPSSPSPSSSPVFALRPTTARRFLYADHDPNQMSRKRLGIGVMVKPPSTYSFR